MSEYFTGPPSPSSSVSITPTISVDLMSSAPPQDESLAITTDPRKTAVASIICQGTRLVGRFLVQWYVDLLWNIAWTNLARSWTNLARVPVVIGKMSDACFKSGSEKNPRYQ